MARCSLLLTLALAPALATAGVAHPPTSLDRADLVFGSPVAVEHSLRLILDPASVGGLDAARSGITCRTPWLHAALRQFDGLSPDLQALVASAVGRPRTLGGTEPAGDRIWLHTARPDARELGEHLQTAVGEMLGALGDERFPAAPLDVWVLPLDGATGSVVWEGRTPGVAVGVVVADRLEHADLVREALHQLFHVWQLERAGASDVPASWLEGSAVYAAATLAGEPRHLAAAVAPGLPHRARPIEAMSPRLLTSRASLAAYLCEASGMGLGALELLFRPSPDGFAAQLGRTLASLDLGSAAAFHLEHALWLSLTAPGDRGRYFSFAAGLAPLRPGELDGAGNASLLLGAGAFDAVRVSTLPRDGGSWITVRSSDDSVVRGAVILRRSGPGGGTRVAPLPAAPGGEGFRIGVPLRGADDVVVVVASSGPRQLSVQVSAVQDPVFPYVLSSFTSEPTAGGVLLQWTVSEEKGVAGWRVMRSLDAGHGFTPLQAAIPARGNAQEPLSYSILDASARPGRRYFYYLEGASVYGFTQPSQVVSVTTPPAR